MAKRKTKAVEYEQLGRAAQDLILKSYGELYNLRRLIWTSFVRGIFIGIGTVIGATVVVGILAYLLQRFDWLPVIGEWFRGLSETIRQ